jgi:two-component system CheB/CheR fusion protein
MPPRDSWLAYSGVAALAAGLALLSAWVVPLGWWTAVLAAVLGVVLTRLARVRAGEAARRRAALDALEARVAVLDRRAKIVLVNDAWQRLAEASGTIATSGVGANYLDVCRAATGADAPEAAEVAAGVRAVLERRSRSFTCDYACTIPGGQRWYTLSVTPLGGPRGGAVVAHVDITERKQAEETLRTSEERYRALVAATAQIVWSADERGETRDVSGWSDLTGQEPGQMGDLGWLSAVHPDDRARVLARSEEVRETHAAYVDEFRIITPDGRERIIEARGVPVYRADGSVREWVGTGRDVTEAREADQALRASEERLRLATTAAGIGTWDWDLRSGDVRWSEGAEPGRGLSAGPLATTPETFFQLIHAEDRDRVMAAVSEALATPGEHAVEFRVVRADGEVRWGEARGTVLRDETGRPVRMIGVAVDITEQKRREAERQELLAREQEARAAAESANRTKDEFLAMLGHELRNPIAAVRNAVTAARLDERRRERALDIARRQTDQLARLVDDLMDVARITQGRIQLRRERVGLAGVLQGAVDATRLLVEDRGHTLTVAQPSEPVELEGDPVRLEQIFTNLLANAAKYTNRGGRIEVEATHAAESVTVCVRDTGIGIAPEMLPRIFDLFTQATRALDRGHGGLGIGLTVVKRLVELHGGRVEGRSEGPGRGAEFVVRLPAVTRAQGELGLAVPEGPTPARRAHVLIVEDDPDAAESLSMLVELLGHEVEIVHDGPAALAAVHRHCPDAALVDIGLPGMDGYELAGRLCALGDDRPPLLIALTGFGRDEDRQRALAAGFDHHAVKPVEMEALAALLAHATAERTGGGPERRAARSAALRPHGRSRAG